MRGEPAAALAMVRRPSIDEHAIARAARDEHVLGLIGTAELHEQNPSGKSIRRLQSGLYMQLACLTLLHRSIVRIFNEP